MDIEPHVESLRRQLEVVAEAGGDEARALVERLIAPLEAAIRLTIQDALTVAAEEITLELAPGSVELRLRGREPEFVVSLPPTEGAVEDVAEAAAVSASQWREDADGATTVSRINLRLPDRLKSRVEQAAELDGLSVNAWLVRAAAAELERRNPTRRRQKLSPHGAQRYTGWAR